jgi:tripartite ATP-independent transporter DctP family solute receptor
VLSKDGERGLTRRALVTAGAALPLCATITRRGFAAQFSYKLASGPEPSHPINIRLQEAQTRIREATAGRLEIELYPAGQLGSASQAMVRLRSGEIDFLNLPISAVAAYVHGAGIANTAFAFPDYTAVWAAMDGELGRHVQGRIGQAGLVSTFRCFDNGFRHITTETRRLAGLADLQGLKLRVPPAPMLVAMFKALGTTPVPMDFAEVYLALRTHAVDGQENPLPMVDSARLYEVQKYCALTGHAWDGFLILGHRRAWERLPEDIRAVCRREFDRSAEEQRADMVALNATLRRDLADKGMEFSEVDPAPLRAALSQAGFYRDWQADYGGEAWGILEAAVGKMT